MSTTEADELLLARLINQWGLRRNASLRDGNLMQASQIGNWLFGAEVVLTALGLTDLAVLANAAQGVTDVTEDVTEEVSI